jgi:hypothetical protein
MGFGKTKGRFVMLKLCPRRSCNGTILVEDTGHGKEYVCTACNRHWGMDGRFTTAHANEKPKVGPLSPKIGQQPSKEINESVRRC